jgi:hypothetical protein
MDFEIEKFSPTKAELTKLVVASKGLGLPDHTDKAQLRKIKDARLSIRDARVAITKTGKALREDALKFQKAVIAKEKELIAIIEPEENRLAELEGIAEKEALRVERLEVLPHRKERLAAIGDGIDVSDVAVLEMDGPMFEGYVNERIAKKNEADRVALEAREAAIREEETRQQRETEMREREEKARQEERERLEREQKDKAEREEREKEDAARKEREEQERMKSLASYQAFLKEHGYTDETAGQYFIHADHIAHEVMLYKLVGIHKTK